MPAALVQSFVVSVLGGSGHGGCRLKVVLTSQRDWCLRPRACESVVCRAAVSLLFKP
jgi:hypothetical protein